MLVKTLNQTHPDRDVQLALELDALRRGGKAWRALMETWLPKRAVEPHEIYAERKDLALYTNEFGPIVAMVAAYLFGEAPVIDGPEGDYWEALAQDCDHQGTPWARWWRELTLSALTQRQVWAWVNLPSRAGIEVASLADELGGGLLDAFLVDLDIGQVLDWAEQDPQVAAQRGRLKWVLFRDIVHRRDDPLQARTKVWRWTLITDQVIQRWEWSDPEGKKAAPADEDEATEVFNAQHGCGCCPVVMLELPQELWLGHRMRDPAVGLLRARNELSWALHQSANELLVVTARWAEDGKEDPTLGHGHYLKLSRDTDGVDQASFIAPSGMALQHLSEDVASKRRDLYRVVQQVALDVEPNASQQRASGESKKQDWQALDILLNAYAELARDAMQAVAKLIARIRREADGDIAVTGLDGWQSEDLMTFLEAGAMATDARQLSPQFRKALARRQARRLLGSEVSAEELAVIEKEIEEADPAEGLMPPALASMPGQQPGAGSNGTPDDEEPEGNGSGAE